MSTEVMVLAIEWSPSDSRWFALLVVGALIVVLAAGWRATWHRRRLLSVVALIVVASSFAALSRGDIDEQHFEGVTAGPVGGARSTFRLVVVGDFGTGGDQQWHVSRAVHDWVREHGTDAFVSAGDTIYPVGNPRYFEESWSEPYGWLEEEGIEVIGTLGNHDYAADDKGRGVMDLLGMPDRWYRVTIGDADVIVLDGNEPNDPDQRRWFERQLRTTDGVWTIVMVHQPPFSCSREGDADVRRAWVESLERNGVDLVISGHEHNYQRLSSATGTTYIVTGGGGDTLYDVDDDCELRDPTLMAADDDDFHFFVVEGSRERIDAQAIGMDASVLDRFTIRSREKEVDRPAAE